MANKKLAKQIRKTNHQRKISKRQSLFRVPYAVTSLDTNYDSLAQQELDYQEFNDMANESSIEHDMGRYSVYY